MENSLDRDSFASQLETLHRRYEAELPGKIDLIGGLIETLATQWQGAEAVRARQEVHRLTGSSGTYGLFQISREAKALEALLVGFLRDGASLLGLDLLRQQFRRLREAAAELRREAPSGLIDVDPNDDAGEARRDESLVVLVGKVPESREDLPSLLQASGYRLRHIENAGELQSLVDEPIPAAVLVDLQTLPAVCLSGAPSGAVPPSPEGAPPQIVFSSEDRIEARLRAVRAGSVAYLTEPLDPELLIETLDRLTMRTATSPYRVLVIDDDPAASAQTSLHLRRKGMRVTEVSDPLEVLAPLVELQPDLILMDLHMPGCNGMELAATLRQYDSKMRVPIVFLSAESDPLTQFGDMLKVGEDVLDKSIAPQHMVLAVANHARRSRLLSSLMTRDCLTGLLSHALLMERLDQEIGKARRLGQPLAFAMADLDGFKSVNDQHGHRAGDRVLRSFGRFVRRELAEGFLVGRYGGDEFGIVLPGIGVTAAGQLLNRVRRRFAAIRHSTPTGGVRVTLSMGIAGFPHHHELSTLTRAADLALYRAKEEGRNRVAQAI